MLVINHSAWQTLREKWPNIDYFCSVFSCIRTEYGDLRRKSPYPVEYRKIQTRNHSVFGHFSRSEKSMFPYDIFFLVAKFKTVLWLLIRKNRQNVENSPSAKTNPWKMLRFHNLNERCTLILVKIYPLNVTWKRKTVSFLFLRIHKNHIKQKSYSTCSTTYPFNLRCSGNSW